VGKEEREEKENTVQNNKPTVSPNSLLYTRVLLGFAFEVLLFIKQYMGYCIKHGERNV